MTALRPPASLVSTRARAYWTVRALVCWLVVGTAETLVLLGGHPGWGPALAMVTGGLALAHIVVMPRWRYRVHRWETTSSAVYTQTGWFRQERRIAPIARIQTVDTRRGPLEQLFRLANVTVTTGSAAGPLKIEALDRRVADTAAAELTALAQRHGGDGT